MVALSVRCAVSDRGEERFNVRAYAAYLVDQYFVRRRIDRIWSASDRAHFRTAAVLQPGGWAAGRVGRRRGGGDANLRRDLRSVDWRMVRPHAIAMAPAPSVNVCLRDSGRGRLLLPVRPSARMDDGPSAYLPG